MYNKNCKKKQQKRHSLPIELHFEIARFFSCTKILQFLSNHTRWNKNTAGHDSAVGGDENIFDRILFELPAVIIGQQLPDNNIIDERNFFDADCTNNVAQQNEAAAAADIIVVDAGDDFDMVFGHLKCECCFCVALINSLMKLKLWKKWQIIDGDMVELKRHADTFLRHCKALRNQRNARLFVGTMAHKAFEIAQQHGLLPSPLNGHYIGKLQAAILHMVQVFGVELRNDQEFQFYGDVLREKGFQENSSDFVMCRSVLADQFEAIPNIQHFANDENYDLCYGIALCVLFPLANMGSIFPANTPFDRHAPLQSAHEICLKMVDRFRIHHFSADLRSAFKGKVLGNFLGVIESANFTATPATLQKLYAILVSMLDNILTRPKEDISINTQFNAKARQLLTADADYNDYLDRMLNVPILNVTYFAQIIDEPNNVQDPLNFGRDRKQTIAKLYALVFFAGLVGKCNANTWRRQ